VVVALDDFAALNILALGVTPDLSYDAFGYATTKAIFEREGMTSSRTVPPATSRRCWPPIPT